MGSQLQPSDAISLLPVCALDCVIGGLSASTCSLTNASCICTTVPLQAKLSICVQDACNFTEQQRVADVNGRLCVSYPIENNGQVIVNVTLIFGIIALAVILLRCYSRWKIAGQLWWDDWSILTASVMMSTLCILAVINCYKGFGGHYWRISTSEIVTLLKIFWVNEILYNTTLATTRISILFFYLRVFHQPLFKRVVWITISLILVATFSVNLVIICQCTPIYAVWNLTVPRSKCINVNALAYTAAGIGVSEDIFILVLPLPVLWKLQMTRARKVNLLAMFCLGGFACITSIVRLRFLVAFGGSRDPTWDDVTPTVWSIIEISIAQICACLPAIRAILSYWFPTIFAATAAQQYPSSYNTLTDSRRAHLSSLRLKSSVKSFSNKYTTFGNNSNGEEVEGIRLNARTMNPAVPVPTVPSLPS